MTLNITLLSSPLLESLHCLVRVARVAYERFTRTNSILKNFSFQQNLITIIQSSHKFSCSNLCCETIPKTISHRHKHSSQYSFPHIKGLCRTHNESHLLEAMTPSCGKRPTPCPIITRIDFTVTADDSLPQNSRVYPTAIETASSLLWTCPDKF